MSTELLWARGLELSRYPQREAGAEPSALRDLGRALRSRFARGQSSLAAAHALLPHVAALARTDAAEFEATLVAMRGRLRRDGLTASEIEPALVLVSATMARTLGKTPYDTQLEAARLLLDGRLVEMATGEGKTLSAALAASAAALAGVRVHVLTANDYLAARDRDTLLPLYTALGLTSGAIVGATPRAQRFDIYRCDVVHSTARELAFDYLHDHRALAGERDPRLLRARSLDDGGSAAAPALPGLCFAVVDEADSILLDGATLPLILAAPTGAIDVEAYRRAYQIACGLNNGEHFVLHAAQRAAALTGAGRLRVAEALHGAQHGALRPLRRAHELVEAALVARWLQRRDHEYAVGARGLQLIDEVTGRIAEGRQWTGALHQMVEIKEGLEPTPPSTTAAQITYQRFFARYLHLGGTSGTLHEARHELQVLYGSGVVGVPLARPKRRRWLGEQVFTTAEAKWHAVVVAVQRERASGRPILVGTDSVAASEQLSTRLHTSGIEHQVLHALQDADEARRIARAGERGVVTVATNIAGRGTDIHLGDGVAALGGLHVIATMRNRSPRIDRQLIGRSARHGDPGSAERMLSLEDGLLRRAVPQSLRRAVAASVRGGCVPTALARALFWLAQARCEWQDRHLRRQLRRTEQQLDDLYGFAGGTE